MPWRNTDNAYHIYISEVMLQQTQVKTVLERFYFPFLERFPSLDHLAQSDEQDVLHAWQGLGYYSRARNLRKAAQLAAPSLPTQAESLIKLPGIGKNTAYAICAFAYKQPLPVMEANLKRVLCRFFGLSTPSQAVLWEKAHALLDAHNPFDYNQAMMDIGAMLCTPKAPQCGVCPLAAECAGKDFPEHYPAKKSKKHIPERRFHSFIFQYENTLLMHKRTTRFLHGLYCFMEGDDNEYRKMKECYPQLTSFDETISQSYSHFKAVSQVHHIVVNDSAQIPSLAIWVDINDLKKQKIPVSGIEKKIAMLIQ